jgi:sirohydrochlorin cobaltochelatase
MLDAGYSILDTGFVMPPRNAETGMLLVGHGTRVGRGIAEFLEVAKRMARLLPEVPIEPAFLELAEPRIDQAVARLIAQQVAEVIVVPLLFFEAAHAKDDIPNAVAKATRDLVQLELRQAEPLGCHDKIVEASAQRFCEAIGDRVEANDVLLIMVGRGSSDDSATALMRRFTDLRTSRTPVSQATTAFMAIAEPSVSQALEAATRTAHQTVVVQPHLLFQGQLLERLHDAVAATRSEMPTKKWVVADHLGPSEFVVDAVIDRFVQAVSREGL